MKNLIFFFGLLASQWALAQGVIYRCTGEDGVPNYTNNPDGKKCERVQGIQVTTIPAFKPPVTGGGTSGTSRQADAQDFPRISSAQQAQRDQGGKRGILEQELKDKEARCDTIKKEFNNGAPPRLNNESTQQFFDRVVGIKKQLDLCEGDLASLKRELAAIK